MHITFTDNLSVKYVNNKLCFSFIVANISPIFDQLNYK